MHRTQLYLDEAHYQYVLSLSKRQGISLAQVFRELIDERMSRGPAAREEDSFFGVIGIGEGTGEAVAEHYEDFLYGEDL